MQQLEEPIFVPGETVGAQPLENRQASSTYSASTLNSPPRDSHRARYCDRIRTIDAPAADTAFCASPLSLPMPCPTSNRALSILSDVTRRANFWNRALIRESFGANPVL